MNKSFRNLYAIALVIVSLTACKPNESKIANFFSCETNCWFMIEPGKTKKSEVIKLLLESQSIKHNSIMNFSQNKSNDSLLWKGKNNSLYASGFIYFNNDEIVDLIRMDPKKASLKLENILEKYGQPDQVLVLSSWSEIRLISTFFIYQQEGYVFSSLVKGKLDRSIKELEINGNEEIIGLWYCEPSEVYKFLIEGPINRMNKSKFLLLIQKWKGENFYEIDEN